MARSVPDEDGLADRWVRTWEHRGWGGSASAVATVLALFDAHRALTNRIDRALRPLGLTLARFEVLTRLLLAGGSPQHVTALADVLQVHPTSVSSALDRLSADGLVLRMADVGDRRKVLVELTPAGRTRVEEATEVLTGSVLTDLGLTDAGMATLLRVIGCLRANAGDFIPAASRPQARSA